MNTWSMLDTDVRMPREGRRPVAAFPFGETWVQEHPVQPIAFQFTGKELDEETGLYYFGARYYDPRTSLWQSADPVLGRYLEGQSYGGVYNSLNLNLYGYGYQNPVKYLDPDGAAVETAWDAFNVGLGVASFVDNVRQGNYWGAALDAVGVAVDSAATVVPFVPGGAGTIIKAGRAVDKTIDAVKTADKAIDVAKAAERAAEVAKTAEKGAEVAKAADKGSNAAKKGIYEFKDQVTGKPYVGQSGDIDRRLTQHVKAGRLDPGDVASVKRTEVTGGKTAREVTEHRHIQEITGGVPARRSPDVANKVDPIGPKRQHLLE